MKHFKVIQTIKSRLKDLVKLQAEMNADIQIARSNLDDLAVNYNKIKNEVGEYREFLGTLDE